MAIDRDEIHRLRGRYLATSFEIDGFLTLGFICYFQPAREVDRFESTMAYHVSFEDKLLLVPLFLECLDSAGQTSVEERSDEPLRKRLDRVRERRNKLAHGSVRIAGVREGLRSGGAASEFLDESLARELVTSTRRRE